MPFVDVRGLGVRYLTRRAPALRDVTFALGLGERLLVAGASGSGKSTLGLALAGLIPTSIDADVSGAVGVDGQPTTTYGPGDLASRIGTVFQDPSSQFTMLSVEDEVAFGLENLGVPSAEMPRRVAAALAAVGLADRAGWRIDRLSGGQQQRVAVAAALAMEPRALVLDEPTAHLDPRGATELYETVHAVADRTGALLVAIEHDVDRVVPSHVERGLLLDRQGCLLADALIGEVFGSAESARRWEAEGVRLPSAAALALALEEPGPSERLPLSVEDGASWLVDRPPVQRRLREAAGRSSTRGVGDPVLRARGLRQRYVGPVTSYLALHDVDLCVAEGELVAIVGANGSGKSTLLRTLTGLLRPEHGEVAIGGRSLSSLTSREVAHLVSLVFQNPEAGFVADTVQDEIAFGPRALVWSAADVERHTRAMLERFGLSALARANPFSLSEGQKRRLSVATSLVLGPRALLLDEPTFGQDRQSAQALMDEIGALRDRGLAVVVATHDLSLVHDTADRVLALADGQVMFDGPPADLIADRRLLATVGQEPPVLDRLLCTARRMGAEVPRSVRWRDVLAVGAGRGRALTT